MKIKKLKSLLVSLWLYIWYKPVYKADSYWSEDISPTSNYRWYSKPRAISWLLISPLIIIIGLIGSILENIISINDFLRLTGSEHIMAKKNISFRDKLDIVRILHL